MRRLVLLCFAIGSVAYADVVLTNSPAWNGSSTAFDWGTGGATPTYGETITVPTDGNDVLSSFTFYIFGGSPSLSFNAYVQTWNGTNTTGSPLFTGSGSTVTTAGASAYTFSPNISLTAGGVYILYFSTLGISQSGDNGLAWGATPADTYSGGAFEFSNVGGLDPGANSINKLNTGVWGCSTCTEPTNLAFSATFTSASTTAVPEPRYLALSVVAVLGAFGSKRFKLARRTQR